MKKPIFYFILAIMISSFLLSPSTSSAHSGHEQTSYVAKYTVTNSNESAVYAYYNHANFSEHWNYQVDIGSEIELEIAEPTNMNSGLNITIGNMTLIGTDDSSAEQELGLGYYNFPDELGFISSGKWDIIESTMKGLDLTAFSMNKTAKYTFGAATFDAVNITFSAGIQTTSLSYNAETGILYYANVSIRNFKLEFHITGYIPYESNDEIPSSTSDAPLSMIGLFSLLSLALLVDRKKRTSADY